MKNKVVRGWAGWGDLVERDRFPYLAFPAPALFFLASSILPLFDCKTLSIVESFASFSAATHSYRTPALSSLATHPSVHQLTRAPAPCPPPIILPNMKDKPSADTLKTRKKVSVHGALAA